MPNCSEPLSVRLSNKDSWFGRFTHRYIVAMVGVRHALTAYTRKFGVTLVTSFVPIARNQGIATFAVREALQVLRDMGVHKALLISRRTQFK
jgi:predicted acetyltransferase